MMVPQMVGDLLTVITESDPTIKRTFDPFVGSGTAPTETMMRGLDFTGQDVNPLAILLCQTKTIPFFDGALEEKAQEVVESAAEDNKRTVGAHFPNRPKWFQPGVAVELSRLRRAIRGESAGWARKFFWVALAVTVRLKSKSRTSTYKLHIRPAAEIAARRPSPIDVFEAVVERNTEHLRIQKEVLTACGHVERGHYRGSVDIRVADSFPSYR